MYGKSNIKKKQITFLYLFSVIITYSSVMFLVTSPLPMNIILNGTETVYAQGNKTNNSETADNSQIANKNQADEADDSGSSDVDDGKTETADIFERQESKSDKEDKPTIGEVKSNEDDVCGINPNAPPCCTPGEDENCIDVVEEEEMDTSKLAISDFKTIPEQVNYGEEFKVQVTIENDNDVPISFRGDECGGSPLNIKYDSYVNIYRAISCQSVSTETLGAHESTTVEGKGNEILRAIGVGESHVDVAFYFTAGENPNQGIISDSFTFDIQDPNENNPPQDPSFEGIPQTQSSANPQGIPQTQSTGNQQGIPQGPVTGEVVISDFKATPSTISPGIPFTYEVKVTNNMNAPIYFYNSCSKTGIGYNVENTIVSQHPGSFCDDLTVNKIKLDQGSSTIAYGPGKGFVFVYATPGEKNIDINLYYNIGFPQGTEGHTEWKSFTIISNPT